MRIVPPIRPIRDGKILDVNLINHIINRTEYGADLLSRYKMVAGTNMFVEQAANGLGISYLTALAGGAGNPVGSGSAGTGSGGAGTGTGGAGTGSGGSGTPQPVAFPYRIVGRYFVGGVSRGFVYDGLKYTDIFIPGSSLTNAFGVSGSRIVGSYTLNQFTKGFLYNGSTFADIYVPNSVITTASDIDGSNIIGSYSLSGFSAGFLFNGATFTDILFPDAYNVTNPISISGTNIIVWVGNSSYLYNGSTFLPVNMYGSFSLRPYGIDGLNIVGRYVSGNIQRGYLYDGSTFTDIFVPGSTSTICYAIAGLNIAGTCSLNGFTRGFLYNGSTFTDIFFPGSTRTEVWGIG